MQVRMASSLIFRISIVLFQVNMLDALFPNFLHTEDIYLNDIVVKIPKHAGRIPRSSDPPKQMSVYFNVNSDEISFNLTQNEEINPNVPIYTTDHVGNVVIQQILSSETVRFYQDRKNGASFMIKTNNTSSCMVGTFLYKGDEYAMEPIHCLLRGETEAKYKIARLKRNPLTDIYTLKSGVEQTWMSSHNEMIKNRQKRQSLDYNIELFFIIDFSIYDYWYKQSGASTVSGKDTEAKESIREFYSFVVNGIDVRYESIQTAYTISVLFSGIYVADTPSKSQFVESLKITSSTGTQVDSSEALDAVKTWIQATPGLPQHDHAMMFTRYDFTRGGSTAVAGLAYLGALCTDQSVSVVEDHFDFNVLTTAAHELGHGLGARHDGDNNTCLGSDSFVMAAMSIPVNSRNPWKFSSCSVNYFTTYINKLNRENNNCMTVLSSGYDPWALQNYTSLPGEVYDADSHCRHIIGPGSSLCKNVYSQNFSSICTKLWCRKPDGSGLCTSSVGGDGLRCGDKKWCISGECKYDVCAPHGNENCLYGDSEGVVLRYPDKNITCSFQDIKSRPYVCYQVESKCCQQCKHFHTGITGCEYGDRINGCTVLLCTLNPDLCCGTCYDGPAITTPSQEPTTPKYENTCKTTVTTSGTTSTTANLISTTTQQTPTSTQTTKTTQQTTAPSTTVTTTEQTTTASPTSTATQETLTTTIITKQTTTPSTTPTTTTTQQTTTTTPSTTTSTIPQKTTQSRTTTTTPSTTFTTNKQTTTASATSTTTQQMMPSTTTQQQTTSPATTIQRTASSITTSIVQPTTTLSRATTTTQQTTKTTTEQTKTPSSSTHQETSTPATISTKTTKQSSTTSTLAPTQITQQTETPITSTTKQQIVTTTTRAALTTSWKQTTKQATTTQTTSQFFVFRLTIILLIEEAIDDMLLVKIQSALEVFYYRNELKYITCRVKNVRRGSLIVDYDVETPKTSQSVIQMTTLLKSMASGKSKVSYEGQEVTVSSVSLKDSSGVSLRIGSTTSICEIQNIVGPCPTGYACENMSMGPVCRESSKEKVNEKYRNYIIYAGVGAAVVVMIFVCCICYFHIKRMSKLRRKTNSKYRVHGVTNLAMDDTYKEGKQFYIHKA